jgi:hypothetical protein
MKQLVFNLVTGNICFPVFILIRKTIGKEEVVALWVGFCLACLINGIICFIKER